MARAASKDDLETYRAKRNFAETREPSGGKAKKAKQGFSFVVQKHDATRLHYDFRLELDGVLKSWAVTRGPSYDPRDKRLAVQVEDHPLEYGGFEGTIPKGQYGGGTVMLWDRGTWEPLGDPHEGLEKGDLKFRLSGERMTGEWVLVRMKGGRERGDSKRQNWLLIKHRDETASEDNPITETATTSVATGRTLDAIAAGNGVWRSEASGGAKKGPSSGGKPPKFVEPALCTLVDEVPEGGDWLFEVKFDGYRVLAAVDGDDVRLYTRRGLDWTERFGRIAPALRAMKLKGALIDGEVVVVGEDGRTDFGALQNALDGSVSNQLSFFAFDLLVDGHKTLQKKPLTARKERLAELLGDDGRRGPVFYTDHLAGNGKAMLDALCGKGFEGVIAKRGGSPYRSGRGTAWLKIKCDKSQEFVIAGWSDSDKNRPFASLLLGVQEKDGLRYAGRVGSGFSDKTLEMLAKRFKDLATKTQPFAKPVPRPIARDAHWVRPELVAQIDFAGFTDDNYVRHGRFIGLREDKPATEVVPEMPKPLETVESKPKARTKATAARARVRLTSPEKLLYPADGVTKQDVADYLASVAKRMLPFAERRLVSLVRCPEGTEHPCFFQKHESRGMPDGFHKQAVREKDGGTEDYLYVDSEEGIVSAAQIGALELHIWGSHIDDIERPDRLVMDFDPAEDVAFETVKAGAIRMREALEALGLKSFPLLTGGKGIHVVAPLLPEHEWPVVKAFARGLAEHFAEHEPDSYVATMSKAKRGGKIFIDHFRNERGSTAITPYSPRARAGAPVAWPVDWEALKDVTSANSVTIANAADRLGERPWKSYFRISQTLTPAALKAFGVDDG
jgi:bifunctional non-homologous end joining protein LigD